MSFSFDKNDYQTIKGILLDENSMQNFKRRCLSSAPFVMVGIDPDKAAYDMIKIMENYKNISSASENRVAVMLSIIEALGASLFLSTSSKLKNVMPEAKQMSSANAKYVFEYLSASLDDKIWDKRNVSWKNINENSKKNLIKFIMMQVVAALHNSNYPGSLDAINKASYDSDLLDKYPFLTDWRGEALDLTLTWPI